MKLIPEASKWYKLWSVRMALLAAVFGALELSLPLWQGLIPEKTFAALATLTAVGTAVARLLKQNLEGRDV